MIAAERNPRAHLTQRLTAALLKKQGPSGAWSDELWDTAWAVKALLAMGYSQDDAAVARALRFIAATQDPIRGSWYEEPFETMLVLELLADLKPDSYLDTCGRPIDWLCSLQSDSGAIIGVRYTGMAISLLSRFPDTTGRFADVMTRAEAWLRSDLEERTIWTGAGWSNYYPLRALLDRGATLDDPCVRKAVEWFLAAQDADGRWMQVSRVHDTAMSLIGLTGLLKAPLLASPKPRVGILAASRENGTLRVTFQSPGASAVTPTERLKLSEPVRAELGRHQRELITLAGAARGTSVAGRISSKPAQPLNDELARIGRYAYGHLVPPRIQLLLETSPADHLLVDVDERLLDLPWELLHDQTEFLCMRYALGRRLSSDQPFTDRGPRAAAERALVIANPTGDLPAAEEEGLVVADLLKRIHGLQVTLRRRDEIGKQEFLLSIGSYDVVHYAGHASYAASSPDESALKFFDGSITAFEIERFIAARSPAVVFLNACWSAEEYGSPGVYSAMMRGLGRTFLYSGVSAFLGYVLPVPDVAATGLAVAFYRALGDGQTIGEALRQARLESRAAGDATDITWSSAILYGDPAARVATAS